MSVRASTLLRRAHLLGRHVERRADAPRWRLRERMRPRRLADAGLRDAEVEHLHERRAVGARASRKRFAGLRSRWMMPSACASAIASQAWST